MKKLFTFLVALSGFSAIAQPVASFSVSGADPTFTFTNTTTGYYDYSYWDFGDGNYSNALSAATHTYTFNGSYLVCLTVIDSVGGYTSSFCDSVIVVGAGSSLPCSAHFGFADSTSYTGFWFDGSGTINNYFWDFGDGSSGAGAYPIHSYASTGTYYVCLTVTNSSGCSDTWCDSVYVGVTGTGGSGGGGASCYSYFYWFPDSTAGTTIYLVNMAYGGGGAVTYTWDFGDGSVATGAYPTHTYATGGTYNVCLTVTDALGCSETYCDSLVYVFKSPGFSIQVISPNSLGVEENKPNDLSVYPNPATDILHLESAMFTGKEQIHIYAATGAKVLSHSLTFGKDVNVSNLTNGLYFIQLTDSEGVVLNTLRVLVTK